MCERETPKLIRKQKDGGDIGEAALVAAVLRRAIIDAHTKTYVPMTFRRNARLWLQNVEDFSEFSFSWCCEQLNICAVRLTRSLKNSPDVEDW